MKRLQDYISDSEAWVDNPAVGDDFAINIREECLVESHIVDVVEDGVVLAADDRLIEILESYGMLETADPYRREVSPPSPEEFEEGVAEGSDKLQGTPVISLKDLTDKDYTKDKYSRSVPKKLKKDDPRVKFYKEKDWKALEEYCTHLASGLAIPHAIFKSIDKNNASFIFIFTSSFISVSFNISDDDFKNMILAIYFTSSSCSVWFIS